MAGSLITSLQMGVHLGHWELGFLQIAEMGRILSQTAALGLMGALLQNTRAQGS